MVQLYQDQALTPLSSTSFLLFLIVAFLTIVLPKIVKSPGENLHIKLDFMNITYVDFKTPWYGALAGRLARDLHARAGSQLRGRTRPQGQERLLPRRGPGRSG